MTTKKKAKPQNKPKAIYFTVEMANDLARIRKIRTDPRLSDSALIADAMSHYVVELEDPCDHR